MKTLVLSAQLLVAPLPALAASAEDPVREIMRIAEARLDGRSEPQDYFEGERLTRHFSKRFVAAYQDASRFPAYDDGSGNPFDYDVIINGQDGCPLEDVEIRNAGDNAGVTTVVASFHLWRCVPADAAEYNSLTEVRFDVVSEDGRPVIDDIHRRRDGLWISLVGEMKEIVASGEGSK